MAEPDAFFSSTGSKRMTGIEDGSSCSWVGGEFSPILARGGEFSPVGAGAATEGLFGAGSLAFRFNIKFKSVSLTKIYF